MVVLAWITDAPLEAVPIKLTIWLSPASDTSHEFEFDVPEIVLGRDAGCEVPLPFTFVSAQHCTIVAEGAGYLLTDHGSTNGTIHNGKRAAAHAYTPLSTGDIVSIGEILIQIDVVEALTQSMSIEQTGEEVRQMVFETLLGQGAANTPTLEIDGVVHELSPSSTRVVVGASDTVDIRLSGDRVAPEHFALEQHGIAWQLVPLSSHLTRLDGKSVVDRVELGQAHKISAGEVQIGFVDPLFAYFDDVTGTSEAAPLPLHEAMQTQQISGEQRRYADPDDARDFGPPNRPPRVADALMSSAMDSGRRMSGDEPVSRGFGTFEIGVVVVTIVVVASGLIAILVLFNVV